MEDDELIDRFLDATFDEDEVDHESFLSEGGEEIAGAVRVHQLFQAASESWQEPKRPTQLDRFQIVGDLGAGGIGKVYLGWDPDLRRHVAIKVISRDRWASNEARSIAKLEHRSIVKVYEVGRDHLVMELLDGGTLQDKILDLTAGHQNSMSALRARLHCLVRIAEGLAYCHERGILHRDVKPSNVLFAMDDEHPRLIDFGLAHLDELESLDITQNLVGSPAYLSPEQVQSGETGTDIRSDIFSFGSMAYELLTLTSPFKRDTRQETMDAVSAARPTNPRKLNPEISKSIENILAHCMEPDARQRYASMGEVALDIQDALADRPISVGSRSPVHHARLFMKRHRRVSGFAAMGVSVAALAGSGLWMQSLRTERTAFAEELEALVSRIPETRAGSEVQRLGFGLLNAKYRAETLDRSIAGRMLYTSTPPAEAAIESWSRHVATKLEQLSNFDLKRYPPAVWRGVLVLDEIMLPEAPWNSETRNRGRVTLSPELASNEQLILYKEEPAELNGPRAVIRVHNPVPLTEFPDTGQYRLEIPGIWQRDFLVDSPWCEPIHLEFKRPHLDTTGWVHLKELGILISPLISKRQMSQLSADLVISDVIDDSPCAGPIDYAQKFADWAGGRLPTLEEVDQLHGKDAVFSPDINAAGEHIVYSHILGDINEGSHYLYFRASWKPGDPIHNRVNVSLRSTHMLITIPSKEPDEPSRRAGLAFRVVYPAPLRAGE